MYNDNVNQSKKQTLCTEGWERIRQVGIGPSKKIERLVKMLFWKWDMTKGKVFLVNGGYSFTIHKEMNKNKDIS